MVSIWNGFDWRTEKESQNSQNLLEIESKQSYITGSTLTNLARTIPCTTHTLTDVPGTIYMYILYKVY